MLPILSIGDVLVSPDIITECFCCDLAACGGACCIEGEAGAPVTLDEIDHLEEVLAEVWDDLDPKARAVINRQGVSYVDPTGELVTSIVHGKDCVFTCRGDLTLDDGAVVHDCCLCATEKACREGRTGWSKPISCALYPIREKRLADGTVALNYDRWAICDAAVKRGRELRLPIYQFLKQPLISRFGEEWFAELEETVAVLKKEGRI